MADPPGRDERLRRVQSPLAAASLLSTAVSLETNLLPHWWELGAVTLPPMSLYPVPLAAVVCATIVDGYRRTGAIRLRRLAKGVLAVLVVFFAGNAVVVLNAGGGGVFFAGLPPMLLGAVLSAAVLGESALAAVRTVAEG